MITKGSDYNQTKEFGAGFQTLPKGGYICRIMNAEETADRNGNPMVHISFDIIDGEFCNYFMNLFRTRKDRSDNPNVVKWPFEGQAWISVNDYEDPSKTSSKFKGFCTAVEQSGTEVWSLNGTFMTDALRGAQVGVIYQNQEQEYNGKTYWRAVPWGFRDTSVIDSGDYYVPDDKPLNKSSGSQSGYYGSNGYSNGMAPNYAPTGSNGSYFGNQFNQDPPIPGGFTEVQEQIPWK